MGREVRCQAVILHNRKILVARQYNYERNEEYWILPGGGLEEGETPEDGARREIREEANIEVELDKVLFDDPGIGDVYNRYITYLCYPRSINVQVGSEMASHRTIIELVWVSLDDETEWNEYILDSKFYPAMKDIKLRLSGEIPRTSIDFGDRL